MRHESARLILASGSPRRRALLQHVTPDFDVVPADVEERAGDGTPESAVRGIARRKVEAVHARGASGVILGADTAIVLDGRLLGKPRDWGDARRTLRALSGRVHTVLTGLYAVHTGTGRAGADCVATRVHVRPLDGVWIERYLATGEGVDKAGAYAIQGRGACMVEYLEGDYTNVMGLPLVRTAQLLERVGWRPPAR